MRPSFILSSVLFLSAVSVTALPTQAKLDTAAIDHALGVPGAMQGDVYRVGLPRTDLAVTVDGIAIRPGLALGSWAAFKRAGDHAVVHGDLVLLDSEAPGLIAKLLAGGLDVTAVHNHLMREKPQIKYVHYWGTGPEGTLAQKLHDALAAATKTPLTPPAAAAPGAPPAEPGWVATLQTGIGRTGTFRGGVLGISVPRPETIMMMGVELPPSMGMATALNFQSDGATGIAGTGDFVMTDDEVNPVARALTAAGIEVTALHNHMLHGSPVLYFMHFWAHDGADKVAAGIKSALAAMKTK